MQNHLSKVLSLVRRVIQILWIRLSRRVTNQLIANDFFVRWKFFAGRGGANFDLSICRLN